MHTKNIGDGLRAISFESIWSVAAAQEIVGGDKPDIDSLVVRELRTGETRRFDRRELGRMRQAPFNTSGNSVTVAFGAVPVLGCFRVMGWRTPDNILDLHVEFRNSVNGLRRDETFTDALAFHNIPRQDACLDLGKTAGERLNRCEARAYAVEALFLAMVDDIDIKQALLRGRYIAAVACMEDNGVPIDERLLGKVSKQWRHVSKNLISEVDRHYGVYRGQVFKLDLFSRWLNHAKIPWPRLPSGLLDISDDAFKEREPTNPKITMLRELRQTIQQVKLDGLHIGSDSRSRTPLRPFSSITGRNQPSTTAFAFGPAKWTRGFIRPPHQKGQALIDFASQEIGGAGGLSGDEQLIAAYTGEDPYIAFAIQAGLVGTSATKTSHPEVRNACKAVVLGLNYGMGAASISLQAGITIAQARELIRLHKRTYRRFWRWSEDVVSEALFSRKMSTVFGFRRIITPRDKITSIMNWPMQANGAEMMRIAAIAGIEAGIKICAPVHDAFLIEAPLDCLDEHVEAMRAIMTRAGAAVCGLPIRTAVKVIRYPERYMEDRGVRMWNRVMRLAGLPREIVKPSKPSDD